MGRKMKTQAQVNQKVMDLRWREGSVQALVAKLVEWMDKYEVSADLREQALLDLPKKVAKFRTNEVLSVHTVAKFQRVYNAEVLYAPSVKRVWHRASLTQEAVEVLTTSDKAVCA